jgi:hypothetical protein
VLARLGKLAALLFDLAEQAGVLYRQHRLRGERLQKLDRALRKLTRRLAAHHQCSNNPIGCEQGNYQPGAIAQAHDQLVRSGGRL